MIQSVVVFLPDEDSRESVSPESQHKFLDYSEFHVSSRFIWIVPRSTRLSDERHHLDLFVVDYGESEMQTTRGLSNYLRISDKTDR